MLEKYLRLRYAFRSCTFYSLSSYHEPYSIEASINVWYHEGFFYVIPYGLASGHKWSRAKSYSYWNNTDPDENVSDDEWEQRGKLWDKIALDDWEARRMQLEIIELKNRITGIMPICKLLSRNANWPWAFHSDLSSFIDWSKMFRYREIPYDCIFDFDYHDYNVKYDSAEMHLRRASQILQGVPAKESILHNLTDPPTSVDAEFADVNAMLKILEREKTKA